MNGGEGMPGSAENGDRPAGRSWRFAPWVIAALMLLLPLLAMQFTDEVAWDETDFAIIGLMLLGACGVYELAARSTRNTAYRAAVGVAVVAAFILIWMNLAVGIIGSEDNPANLMYVGVLAVGIVGAVIVRFEAPGMARALTATALAQALVGAVALVARLGSTGANWPGAIVFLTGLFGALWLLSAWLFRKAAREQASAGVTS